LRFRRRRSDSGEVLVTQPRSALEATAQFAETLGTARIAPLRMNLLELSGELSGAAVVSGSEDKI
jgi:hypothetical protein